MKGKIVLWPAARLAQVSYTGEITFLDRVETMADLERAVHGRGVEKYLLDFSSARQKEEASAEGLRTFIGRISDFAFVKNSHVAMVGAPFEHSAATSSMSRVLHYRTGHFGSRPEALEWLGITPGELDAPSLAAN